MNIVPTEYQIEVQLSQKFKNDNFKNVELVNRDEIREEQEKEEDRNDQNEVNQKDNNSDLRRSSRSNFGKPPKILNEYVYVTGNTDFQEFEPDPQNIEEALSGVNADKWLKAMENEYDSIMANNTWAHNLLKEWLKMWNKSFLHELEK